MATKQDLRQWVLEALRVHGGRARLVDVARTVWDEHEPELRQSGDLFYTWQYDMRWAATQLRHEGLLVPADQSPNAPPASTP
jgi:hypothetical protein